MVIIMFVVCCLCFYLEWERWNIACKQFNLLLRTDENATSPEAEAYLKKNQGSYYITIYMYSCHHNI